MFTDGSKEANRIAAVIDGQAASIRLQNDASIFTAETAALRIAHVLVSKSWT